ncbi:MAG: NAD(P)/FAD-dependent oxidoreductase [Deltaproteobacteria bacterium]
MIAPTATLDAAAAHVWDALVVGAGPAGALAARQAALAGKRVLLVDSRSFPRAKVCGACLNGQALAVLKSVGLGTLSQSLGGVPLDRFDVRSQGRGVQVALPEGIAVSRLCFDAALVQAAVAADTAFLPETFASLGDIAGTGGNECRIVTLRYRDGSPVETRARVVLAADGLAHASLREHEEFSSRVAAGSRIGLGGQVSDYPIEYGPGTIFMAVSRHGYAGLVRVEDRLLNVAAAVAPDFVRGAGGPPQALAAVLHEAGFPPIPALAAADWHGTLPLTRRTHRTAARRILLLGDAAGYVEPFTGEGMAWAFAAAAASTPFVERGLANWDVALEDDWHATLRRLVLRRQRWCRALAWALRHPLAIRLVMGTVSLVPSLAAPIVRGLNKPPVRSPAFRRPVSS